MNSIHHRPASFLHSSKSMWHQQQTIIIHRNVVAMKRRNNQCFDYSMVFIHRSNWGFSFSNESASWLTLDHLMSNTNRMGAHEQSTVFLASLRCSLSLIAESVTLTSKRFLRVRRSSWFLRVDCVECIQETCLLSSQSVVETETDTFLMRFSLINKKDPTWNFL